MVFQGLCNSLIIVCGWYNCSLSSACYIICGIVLWLLHIFSLGSSDMYSLVFMLSILIAGIKWLILNIPELSLNPSFINFVDFVNEQPSVENIFTDLAVTFLSLVGIWACRKNIFSQYFKYFQIASIFVLFITAISLQTYSNLFYALSVIIQVASLSNDSDFSLRGTYISTSIVSCAQIVFPYISYFYQKFFNEDFKNEVKYGLMAFKGWLYIELVLVILVHSLYSYLAYNSIDLGRRVTIMYKEPLIDQQRRSLSETSLNIKFIIFYVLGVTLLWLWIFNYPGPAGLIIMTWIFYSLISKSTENLKLMTKYALIPTLIMSLIGFCIASMHGIDGYEQKWGLYTLKSPMVETGLIIFTIVIFCLLYSSIKDISSMLYFSGAWYGRILAFSFNQIYLFSLVVLFLIGLSDINILHSGLMIMCVVFMINPTTIKSHWIWLLRYNMIMLYIRYVYRITTFYYDNYKDSTVFKVIGLTDQIKDNSLILLPYDFLIWILLLTVSLQHIAFQIKVKEESRTEEYFLIKYFNTVAEYISRIEIYVMYAIIIIIIYLSDTNWLNLARLILLAILLFKHTFNTEANIANNFSEAYALFVLFEVYCGALLTSRYLFQFEQFTDSTVNFPNLGFKVFNEVNANGDYSGKDFYASTAADCGIFIASVISSRNCKDRQRKSRIFKLEQDIFYRYFSQPFQYILILVIFSLSVFSKLSLSMLINNLVIGFYEAIMAYHFYSYSPKRADDKLVNEWKVRSIFWKFMFFNTIIFLLLSYSRFLLNEDFFTREMLDYLDWVFFLCGFTKESDNVTVISECYSFLIILVLLIIERHCLQYSCPIEINFKNRSASLGKVMTQISIGDEFESIRETTETIKVLVFVKSIIESLIPMAVLLLAFQKINIISVVYVGAVFLVSCSHTLTSTGFLFAIVILMSNLQYTLMLSNINESTSNFIPSSNKPWQIPWFESDVWPSDDATFLSMGTTKMQLHSLMYDLFVQVFILIYYFYLSISEIELTLLTEKLESFEGKYQMQSENNKSLLRQMMMSIKNYFYLFSRLLVVGIVLLFITQSLGVLSAFYCIFCLVFIIKENDIILSKHVSSYIDLLSWFIRFMVIDLTLQMVIQLPFNFIKSTSFDTWCKYIGLMKIWKTEGVLPEDLEMRYLTILFKIYTFTFLFMVYRMMKSKDYIEYFTRHLRTSGKASGKIGKKMAEKFNDERIREYEFYNGGKSRFKKELTKLEENLKRLNKRASIKETSVLLPSRTMMVELERPYKEEVSTEKTPKPSPIETQNYKAILLQYMVESINPFLFEEFIGRITPFGVTLRRDVIEEQVEKQRQRKNYYKRLNKDATENFNDNSDSSDEEVNLLDNYERGEINYDFEWQDYPLLIIYFIASSTQALVFFCFTINHYKYSSLESIVFPLSAIGYALIDYPRPSVKYFRYMMIYTELVFFGKFLIQLEVWKGILGESTMKNFNDPWKLGFNLPEHTYSQTIFFYVLWDVVVLISLLLHQHYLFKVGLMTKTEKEIETLHQAKLRIAGFLKQLSEMPDEGNLEKSFFQDLLIYSKEEKPGKDLYSATIFTQLVILVYIFCFFSGIDGNSINISEAIRSNQFQGRMVGALIVQIILIIIDRYFYLKQTTHAFKQTEQSFLTNNTTNIALYFRLSVHIFLLVIVHILVFWYFPINGNYSATGNPYCEDKYDTERCNNFEINIYLKWFYALYLIYLVFAALQIKYGMPSFKRFSFPLMREASPTMLALFKAYRKAPFFFELRTLIDWICTGTTLGIYQWFKFEDINAQLFINKCVQRSIRTKAIGDPIEKCEKFYMGVISMILILVIILIPLVIFSTLNPIFDDNKVTSASLEISLVFNKREFKIYSIGTAEEIIEIDEAQWNYFNFSQVSQLVATDMDIMQKITMPASSDTTWSISAPAHQRLCNSLLTAGNNSYIKTVYTFTRDNPIKQRKLELEKLIEIKPFQVDELKSVICEKSEKEVMILDTFYQLIRLPSNGQFLIPFVIEQELFLRPLILTYNQSFNYWTAETLSIKASEIGVRFFTISDRYSAMTLNYSILTFYISIVLALGTLIKYVTQNTANILNFTDMENTEYLETLCAGVYISRMIGNIKKEEELYYELIDILRSTEITKMITGSVSIKQKSD